MMMQSSRIHFSMVPEPSRPAAGSRGVSNNNVHRHAPIQLAPNPAQRQPPPTSADGHGSWTSSRQGVAATVGRGQPASLPSLNQLNLAPLPSMTAWYTSQGHDNDAETATYDVPGSSESEGAQTDNAGGGGREGEGLQSPKRKAQNRVAQRALRKRRAARVSELEAELERQQDIHKKGDEEMTEQISELELELASYQSKCRLLEEMLDQERTERLRAEIEVQSFKRPRTRDKDNSPS